jgi:hypothetical protein
MRRIAAIVAGATLVSLLGCNSLLAPKAPDSMPRELQAVYDDIKGTGKRKSRGYETGIEVGTGKERFKFEIFIDNKDNWEAYVRVPGKERSTTIIQSETELHGWTSGNVADRRPLEAEVARVLYQSHISMVKEAVGNGTATFTYEDPLIDGQFLGYNFKVPRP